MPTRARARAIAKVQLAVKTSFDPDALASSVLDGLGQLSPYALTVDERDTLIELQIAALRLRGTLKQEPEHGRQVRRFLEAWAAFDEIWSVEADPECDARHFG